MMLFAQLDARSAALVRASEGVQWAPRRPQKLAIDTSLARYSLTPADYIE